ncbi:hypothetical protein [Amaricoccus solimangrovi]|uniref:Sulfotransferase domain-containing protein n=1 Tax=Amaricoccus solimangrovi TaxID=2589815 RepID=A0A501WYP5_9RHOB|nr:hypothetical protein [Amaricoccus solimangrovi]TPE53922.1 hypothetical protein FJM51_02430 [Amaricoccus solimangrovi]
METRPVEGRQVVLHIGLPKTGTTFLQHQVFAKARGLSFVHRRITPEWERLCFDLRRLGRWPALAAPFPRHRVASGLRAAAPRDPGTLLVSDENIGVDAYSLWRDRGPSPEQVAARLVPLAEAVAALGRLRVLIGVRRQDQWLASRYAESSRHFDAFGQVDFDRRMARLHGAAHLSGPWRWADYAAVEAAFASALGPENVMLLSLEHFTGRPVRATHALERFLGADLNPARVRGRGRRNASALSENVWRMRGGGELRLTRDVQDMILERFAPSNAELSPRAELDF